MGGISSSKDVGKSCSAANLPSKHMSEASEVDTMVLRRKLKGGTVEGYMDLDVTEVK
jgi:hypothetical protein